MKKFLFTVITALFGIGNAVADEFVVSDITIPQGGSATIEIGLNNPDTESRGFQFIMSFDKAVTASHPVRGARINMVEQNEYLYSLASHSTTEGFQVLAYTTSTVSITGTTGTVASITLTADGSLDVGTTVTGTLSDCTISNTGGITTLLDDVTFTVTIGEPDDGRIKLDETSTTAPVAANGVNVRVIRTIKANEWSTICLPFSMTEEQVEAAFGGEIEEDVFLADFQGYDVKKEGDEIVGIDIDFVAVTSIEANHPYLIKVSGAVSEFTVDGVNIEPTDYPCVTFGWNTGRGNNIVYHPMDFVGTYVADFDFYHDAQRSALFINSNKFYYATANTKLMKAFRAYFDFDAVLPELESAASKIRLVFDGWSTNINELSTSNVQKGTIYNMNGQLIGTDIDINNLPKGVYMIDGKKVAIY